METAIKVELKGEYRSAQEELGPIAESLLNKFGQQNPNNGDFLKISTIDFKNIDFIWFMPKTVPHWLAKTVKIPAYSICLGHRPLAVICVKSLFDFFTPQMTKAVLFHELMHIGYDEKGNYKLVSHDIQDFKSLVKEIGIDYQQAEKMFGEE